jgi:hypothetical protein
MFSTLTERGAVERRESGVGVTFARGFLCTPSVLTVLILPVGQISHLLSSPLCKNISVPVLPKSLLELPPSRPMKGRIAIVTDAGRDAVDAAASGDVRGWQGGSTRPVS